MITVKTPEEIEILREGGKKLASILKKVASAVAPGVTASELNQIAEKMAFEDGDKPAFLGYVTGGSRPYPASLCVSINNEIVHGIPNESEKIIKEGDIVSLDMGLVHKGLFTDSAISIVVGEGDDVSKKLISSVKRSLSAGIKAVKNNACVGDIGFAISKIAKEDGFSVALELAGHGVGYKVHEDPFVPNVGKKGKGEKLLSGMVIAIEPMFNEGSGRIILDDDGWTFKTADGKRSAHFEHTIVVTNNGAEILTI